MKDTYILDLRSSKTKRKLQNLPVNIFWKAVSTFVESNADVSINDNVFFSENTERKQKCRVLNKASFFTKLMHALKRKKTH